MSLVQISKFSAAILSVFLLFGDPINAQETLTLKQCFELADANNVQLRQLRMNEMLSIIDVQQNKDNLLPSVNGNTGYNYALSQARDFETNDIYIQRSHGINLGVGLNASIFEGFSRLYAIRNAELSLDAAELETQIFRNNLKLSIFSAYLEILRASEQINIIEQQRGQLQEQIIRTQKLISSGVLPKGDIIELQSQEAQQQASKVNAENALELAKLNLEQLIRIQEDFTVITPENLPVPSQEEFKKYSVDKIYSDALGYRPEIKANEKRMNIAEYNMKIADALKLPTVSFSSSLGSSYRLVKQPSSVSFFNAFAISQSGFFRQLAETFSWGMGVNANIPIFNKWAIRNNKQRAQLAIEQQKLSEESTEIELYTNIQQAFLSAKANALNFKASETALESAKKAYAIIQKKYDYGTATSLELNTALNNVSISELNNNNARYNYIFSVKILDFYAGEELSLE